MALDTNPSPHWLFGKEHERFRESVRRWVENEVAPHVEQWEREGRVPRWLFERAGELGYLGLKFPEAYGGSDDLLADAVFAEEISRCGSGGVAAAVLAHSGLGAAPVWRYGNEEQKRRYLIPAVHGRKIAALAVTEPHAGSDVASIRTVARRDGDSYVLNGTKVFITNGASADFVVVAAKTRPDAGRQGLSLFIVDTDSPGFRVTRVFRKLGWRASDTAELAFEDLRVPAANLLAAENEGFTYLVQTFTWERILMALSSVAVAEAALGAAIRYSRERTQFGRPIGQFQVLRHYMVDMAVDIEKARALTYRALYLYARGDDATAEAAMAKAYAGEMARRVTDTAVQIHGGYGYMMEFPVQRYWRDARLMSIGGGTTEIMREVIVKRLGIAGEGQEL